MRPLGRGREIVPGTTIIEHMHRSAAFDVYDAWNEPRGCRVIVKTPRPDRLGRSDTRARAPRAGRLLERLTHPDTWSPTRLTRRRRRTPAGRSRRSRRHSGARAGARTSTKPPRSTTSCTPSCGRTRTRFLSSTYLHQREDGKLALGPVWDFDHSAGNVVEPTLAPPEGWLLPGRSWAGALLADPGFQAALAARWRALRAGGLIETLQRTIDRRARALRSAARRNFTRWQTLDRPVFRNQAVHGSHRAAVAALEDWIARRAAWMDGALGG